MFNESEVDAALPPRGFLRDYVHYASQCTDAHKLYHVGAGLAMLTQAIPIDLHVQLGGKLFGTLFVLLVGESSSSRKTSAINIARQLLEDAIPGCVSEMPGSYEVMIDGLRDLPRQLIVYGEFGAFLAASEKSYLTALKTAYGQAFDCNPMGRATVKSKARAAKRIETPRLSLLGGCAPDYLERHTEPVDWMGGFMARWLIFNVAGRQRNFDLPPEEPQEMRAVLVRRLTEMANPKNPIGRYLGLDPAAKMRWAQWYKEVTNSARYSSSEAQGAVTRAPSFALKTAMILAWDYGQARSGDPWRITLEELEPALTFVQRFHIDSVTALTANLAGTKDMNDRRAVLNIVRRAGGAGAPMSELVLGSKLLVRRVREVVETLKEEGTVVDASVPGPAGRRFFLKEAAPESVIVSSTGQVMGEVIDIFRGQPAPQPAQEAPPAPNNEPGEVVDLIFED